MDEPLHRYAILLHRAAALWRTRLDEELRPWGMTQATWRTLWALHLDNCPNQSELAARLGIETPTLVKIIDRMEAKGLLRRLPSETDRRQKRIGITEAGLQVVREIEGTVGAVRQRMLAGIAPADLGAGIRLLETIVANAGGRDA